MSKKKSGINPDLEKATSDLLKSTMSDPMASLNDKTKIIDRALKLEAIKQKASDEEWGAAFTGEDEE